MNLTRRGLGHLAAGLVAADVAGRAWAGGGARRYDNPILPGFYPDPSVCRVGDDYFLVNSSFEYFPGVPLWHSRDLTNWRQIGHCLTRFSQLDLAGVAPSDGIYAPTIRYHRGRFYMATTFKGVDGAFHNFYVHTDDPFGSWSDPVRVAQDGIDPSLFFDDDGAAYWIGNGSHWAPVPGAYVSRIDIATGRLTGAPRLVWRGSGGAYPEGPHLFRRGGYCYLNLAEGGTMEGHMVTIARARSPFGPFEPSPHNPVLSRRSMGGAIRATGHGDFVQDATGGWWLVFLGIRYQGDTHVLGRETSILPVTWDRDGWPVVDGSAVGAARTVANTPIPSHPWPPEPRIDDFTAPVLAPCWIQLRRPTDGAVRLDERPGWLSLLCLPGALDGRDAVSFVGRRLRQIASHAHTRIDFTPRHPGEEAGLVARLDDHHFAAAVIGLRDGQRVAFLRRRIGTMVVETTPVQLPDGAVDVTLDTDLSYFRFGAAVGTMAVELGAHETRYLSSEVAGGYTGVVLAMYATANGQVSTNRARFDHFGLS